MPLIKSGSKKAISKNIETEMHHGKPQKQSIAIAYSVARAAKKKKKMARGGLVPGQNDADELRRNSHQKGRWADSIDEATSISRDTRSGPERSHEDDMQVNPHDHKDYDGISIGRDRQGPPRNMEDDRQVNPRDGKAHLAHGGNVMCAHGGPMHCMEGCYADGGPVPQPSPDPDSSTGQALKSIRGAFGNPKQYAKGGMANPYEEEGDENPRTLAEEVMARRRHEEGPQDEGQIDLETASEEMPNRYDEQDMDVGGKEQYDDRQLSRQPEDSNEHGDQREDDSENEHDRSMVEAIRRRMKSRRGY